MNEKTLKLASFIGMMVMKTDYPVVTSMLTHLAKRTELKALARKGILNEGIIAIKKDGKLLRYERAYYTNSVIPRVLKEGETNETITSEVVNHQPSEVG